MRYIQELREGERVSQIFLCKNKITATAKTGRNYYSLVLQDKTGTLDGKVWELNGAIDHFETMDFIHVDGEVTVYNSAYQINVRRIRRAKEGEYDPKDYFPTTDKDPNALYKELVGYINLIQQPHLRKLAESFYVEDKAFAKMFCSHSAAKSVHHGFIGGLLEHTVAVTRLCKFYSDHYPIINRDLLLTAAMFHDIGKTKELAAFPVNDYTDDGQLLGHIIIGCEMVGEKIREIPGFPVKLASELKHCILAHHGEYEYGSPKKPAIIEAAALYFADNTDAKIQIMKELLENAAPGEWLGFNRLMDSNVKRTVVE
ncbi:MAG: HD domain-containing protein [Lachnospiraceae bacterium]|nr:HD domain-containing protein [Lachnospiraceae bacterium]